MSTTPDARAGAKHWLRRRLTEGPRPKDEWRSLVEATWDHLMQTPARDLIDQAAVYEAADRLLENDLLVDLIHPIAAQLAPVVIAELRRDDRPLRRFIPDDALEELHEAMAKPGLVHPDWVRAMFRGEAAEAVVNDALYRALKDFSTLLPRLMVKLSPVGRVGMIGTAGALAEKLIDDLERRLEPEIKTFLAERAEPVLARAAEFTIAKLDDPASTEFRANFIDFLLSKSTAFLLEAADDELIAAFGSVVTKSARHSIASAEMNAKVHSWIKRGLAYLEDETLGALLDVGPGRARPPLDSLADATWQLFVAVLQSPHAENWMDDLVDELLDEYERGVVG